MILCSLSYLFLFPFTIDLWQLNKNSNGPRNEIPSCFIFFKYGRNSLMKLFLLTAMSLLRIVLSDIINLLFSSPLLTYHIDK